MPTRVLLEGPAIEPLLAQVREEYGSGVRIISADKVRSGGFGGFFAKQHYELSVEVPDETDDRMDMARNRSVAEPAPQTLEQLLERAEAHDEIAGPSDDDEALGRRQGRTAGITDTEAAVTGQPPRSGLMSTSNAFAELMAGLDNSGPITTPHPMSKKPAARPASRPQPDDDRSEGAVVRPFRPSTATGSPINGSGGVKPLPPVPSLAELMGGLGLGDTDPFGTPHEPPLATPLRNRSAAAVYGLAPLSNAPTSPAAAPAPEPEPEPSRPPRSPRVARTAAPTMQPTPVNPPDGAPPSTHRPPVSPAPLHRPTAGPAAPSAARAAQPTSPAAPSAFAGPSSFAPERSSFAPPLDRPTPERVPHDRIQTDRIQTDRIPADRIPADRIPADRIPAEPDRVPNDRVPTPPNRVPDDRVPTDRVPTDRVPDDRKPATSGAPAAFAAPLAANDPVVANLMRVGMPAKLAATISGGDTYAGVLSALASRPAAPAIPDGPGEILVLVGELPHALASARHCLEQIGLDQTHLLLAGPSGAGTGIHSSKVIPGPEDAARRTEKLHTADSAWVVAMDAPVGATDSAWVRETCEAIGATAVWAVVDATRKTPDNARHLKLLGEIEALVVYGVENTSDPATVLGLDLPIVSLDGRPATPHAWAAMLCARIATDVTPTAAASRRPTRSR